MNQVYPNEGLVPMLARLTTATVRFHLYSNNVTPTKATVLADLTEVSGSGYAAVDVAAAAWTLSGVAGDQGTLLAAPIAFTAAGGTWTVYGYYVTAVGGGVLLWCARFDSAPITVLSGQSQLVIPVVGDFSQYP